MIKDASNQTPMVPNESPRNLSDFGRYPGLFPQDDAQTSPKGQAAARRDGEGGYRPDIDGLRAIAVLSVVLYHLSKPLLPGGYVGVDIFFVISGFLITRNIWGEMHEGRFSLTAFYLRRIRRIAPAFFAMLAVTVVAGSLLLLPADLERLARSAFWGALALSNVYFWRYLDTSYFAASSDQEPLLHTWSLGVEEQFYFIWPTLLLFACLVGRRRRATAIGLALVTCIVSFWSAEATNLVAQKFSYYMLPARAGELMVGALLALCQPMREADAPRWARNPWLAEASGLAGLGLICWSLLHLDDNSAFPGINAIYPCVGSALVIFAGGIKPRSSVRRLLSVKPMVYVGLVSYSLYLWHWPVLAFIRYFLGGIEPAIGVAAIVSMATLSWASYRFVELPWRRRRMGGGRQLFLLYVMPATAVCVGTFMVLSTHGLKHWIESSPRYLTLSQQLEKQSAPAYAYPYVCQLSNHDPAILTQRRCIVGPRTSGNVEPGVLLWGDSKAAQFVGVLGRVAYKQGFSFRNATHSSCPPVFGGDYGVGQYKSGCSQFRPFIEHAIESGRYATVVMSGDWAYYDSLPEFRGDLQRTIVRIRQAGAQVVILGEPPFFEGYNRECALRGIRLGGLDCRKRLSISDPGDTQIDRYLKAFASTTAGVSYLDVRGFICSNAICSPYLDGRPIYYDASHLSLDGSWLLGSKLLASSEYPAWKAAFAKPEAPRVRSETQAQPQSKARLPGGYEPDFPYRVRSSTNADARQSPATVALEFDGSLSKPGDR